MKKALITGITGQDGSYLAELLLAKGYEVHGVIRRSSTISTARIDHLYQEPHETSRRLILHYGDLTDGSRLATLISEIAPDEIYNLAAQSHVRVSFDEPVLTGDVTGIGATRMLEAVLASRVDAKFYQASSSEMFGETPAPQSEASAFGPRSPYAAAKLYSHWMTVNYREAHGLFAVSGVLFNHESPRRGITFVTRKISRAVAEIKHGTRNELHLGNLEAIRDWGYAPEYVIAMWRMLQQDTPQDLVIGTGQSATIKDFLNHSFEAAGLHWEDYVRFDERYLRPTEVDELRADASKSASVIDWVPGVSLRELAHTMVEHDLRAHGEHLVDSPIGEMWAKETGL